MIFGERRLREAWERARGFAEGASGALQVRLVLQGDDTLHAVRWELLHDPIDQTPLAHHERVRFSRFLSSASLAEVQFPERPNLRAVVAVANPPTLPPGMAPINVAIEVERAQQGLGDIPITLLDGRERRPPATLAAIAAALRDGVDILYLVCHGKLVDGKPRIWLEQEDSKNYKPSFGDNLVEVLTRLERRPLLIVLASCQGAGDTYQVLAAIGPKLARAGVGAVIAMQGNVPMDLVVQFTPRLFAELRRDGLIDRALAAARAALPAESEWWMPTLWMAVRDGALWHTSAKVIPDTTKFSTLGLREVSNVLLNGWIDGPQDNSTQVGVVTIGGWALAHGSKVDRIEIWIDGDQADIAIYGTPRSDIGGNFGWFWDWDTTKYIDGTHTVQVKVITDAGWEKWLLSGDSSVIRINVNNARVVPPATKHPQQNTESPTRTNKTWKPWGDHPWIVFIVVLSSLAGIIGFALPFFTRESSSEYFGVIINSVNQQAIEGAKVSLDLQGPPLTTFTDSEGNYKFRIALEGKPHVATIRVEAQGFPTYTKIITLQPDNDQIEDIRLVPITSVNENDSIERTPPTTQTSFKPSPSPTHIPVFESIWRGEYYNNSNLSGLPVVVRDNEDLNSTWDGQPPAPGLSFENWSARWSASYCTEQERLELYINYDDAIRVVINNEVVFDAWNGPPGEKWMEYEVDGQGCLDVLVEYRQFMGGARLQFGWY